ncbi:MAG: ATP-binding cassette domain-containing protein [Gaiellaceae bacterium MAG52_C11]|nr:ATP-binding cassette domain-containing protein [Candidatus Gaiellasilicea maunaloa]
MTALVDVRDVFRVHPSAEGGVAALQGLTLSVREGEVCVVLGPSGSGKSTLVRIVAGFDRPSAGSVRVAGLDIASLSAGGAARYRSELLGYADQHYWRALAGELTARQLIGVQLGLAGASAASRDERAAELLERVGLGDRANSRPRELSGGEQQRVALCAALAHRPRLLVADEPTGELDSATARDILGLVAELVREHGTTALVVSHDPATVEVADRVVHVRDGRVSDERILGAGADDAVVVGRGGWLRLPEELLRQAGISGRATVSLDVDRLVVAAPASEEACVVTTQASADPRSEAVLAPLSVETTRALLEARDLTRRFDELTPIDRFSASFVGGRLYAVTGPSGSGKTTLLHLLAGLDLPDAGEVTLDGVSSTSHDRAGRAELRRTRLAFIGQTAGLVPFLGARENVELSLAVRGVELEDARHRAAEALASVGLAEQGERPVAELSAGQRERAAIARAVAARPRAIVADEPTARLDGANALVVGLLFAELARTTGAVVVCATHDPLLIEQADEVVSLG